jgi:hypothetical protein
LRSTWGRLAATSSSTSPFQVSCSCNANCSKCKHLQLINRPSESSSLSLRIEKLEGCTGFTIIHSSAVAYREGGFNPPPPEIPKF